MIYFIGPSCETVVKIGYAIDPSKRLTELQIGCPHELKVIAQAEGGRKDEVALHRRFAEARIRGEWFRSTPRMRELIARLRSGADLKLALSFWKQRSDPGALVFDMPTSGEESQRWSESLDSQWDRRQEGQFAPW